MKRIDRGMASIGGRVPAHEFGTSNVAVSNAVIPATDFNGFSGSLSRRRESPVLPAEVEQRIAIFGCRCFDQADHDCMVAAQNNLRNNTDEQSRAERTDGSQTFA